MVSMKRSKKISLIVIALAVLACVVVLFVLRSRPGKPGEMVGTSVPGTSGGSTFDLRVVMPRAGLPLGGILPDALVKKFDGTPSELRLDHTSPGARIGNVEGDRLELSADGGWDLSIEIDSEGWVVSGTRLVFPLALGGRQVKLRCRPANAVVGHLRTTPAGTNQLSGDFLVELATCENAESGRTTNWPPAPLTVVGSFADVPHGRR